MTKESYTPKKDDIVKIIKSLFNNVLDTNETDDVLEFVKKNQKMFEEKVKDALGDVEEKNGGGTKKRSKKGGNPYLIAAIVGLCAVLFYYNEKRRNEDTYVISLEHQRSARTESREAEERARLRFEG